MLDIKFIRQNKETVQKALENRREAISLDSLLDLDKKRRAIIQKGDELKAKRNMYSPKIATLKRQEERAEEEIKEMRQLSETIRSIDNELKENETQINDIILRIPNIPHISVPIGNDEKDSELIRSWGERPEFSSPPKPHWDIGEDLGILDFKRAAKITGARFCLYWGLGARLERALINFMLDVHTKEHGYTEILPPFMVNRDSMTATGQLPKFEEDLFSADNYYLIPTAEVPLTNIYRGEFLREEDLPVKLVAYTPCFRKEAGSYGKDTRGIIRQHQFNKVELVRFANSLSSYNDLEELTLEAEEILKRLSLHYRVVNLCTGDLGFSAAKTYDLEVWMPGQGTYKEISSCTNFEDFQARRAGIRFKSKKKKTLLCHTLNGSGLAVGRTLAAILENYQLPDGGVRIPDALVPYMGLDRIKKVS